MATEKRLIDANTLCKELEFLAKYEDYWKRNTILGVVQTIKQRPTVDAVEVVHGEWTIVEDDYTGLVGLECSECEITWWFEEEYSFDKYHYCPGCGAKMNAKEEKQLLFADMEEIIDETD